MARDEQQSAYLLDWARKLASDQDYLSSLREYPVSGQGRTLEDTHYAHSSIAGFDWKSLGLTHAFIPHSLTLTDFDEDGKFDVVQFPSGRYRLGVIINTKFTLEEFVSQGFIEEFTAVDKNFFVFCDDGLTDPVHGGG